MGRIIDFLLLFAAAMVAMVILALGIRRTADLTPRSRLGRRFMLALALVMGGLSAGACKEPSPPASVTQAGPRMTGRDWRQLDTAWDEINRMLLQEKRDYPAFKRLQKDFKGVAPAIKRLVAAGQVSAGVGERLEGLFLRRFDSLEGKLTPPRIIGTCYVTPARDFDLEGIYHDIDKRIALLYQFASQRTVSGAAVEKVLRALEQDFEYLDHPSAARPSPPVRWAPPGRSLTPEERKNIERILARKEELRQAPARRRRQLVEIIGHLTGVETDEAITE